MAKAGVKVEAGQTWECVTSSDARLIALTLRPFKGRSTAWVCLVLELENASLDGGPELVGAEEWFDVGVSNDSFSWRRIA
jgi:hypothetical protein